MSYRTQERLIYKSGSLYAQTGGARIALMDREEPGTSGAERDANARRLARCWNACEGGTPEAVPEMVEALREFLQGGPMRADVAHEKARAALAKWESRS